MRSAHWYRFKCAFWIEGSRIAWRLSSEIVENRSKTVQNTLDDGDPIASLEKFEGD